MSVRIPVYARGGVVIAWAVVDDDQRRLLKFRWNLNRDGYVQRSAPRVNGRTTKVALHREVMGCTVGDGREIDHRDGDKLNNRRSNLRAVSHQANTQNRRGADRGSTSALRGVSRSGRKWIARVVIDGRIHYLGTFADEAEAGQVAAAFRAEHMAGAVS